MESLLESFKKPLYFIKYNGFCIVYFSLSLSEEVSSLVSIARIV
jgi:hypothetical protein